MAWLIGFHVIAIVCWFSGLFYLPRLFVYHALSEDKISQERFNIMERKLYYGITSPSMIASVVLGIILLYKNPVYLHVLWMQIKLLLVLLLIIYHFYCGYLVTVFKKNNNKHSHIYYRWFNEIPVFFLIAIMLLAFVRPL